MDQESPKTDRSLLSPKLASRLCFFFVFLSFSSVFSQNLSSPSPNWFLSPKKASFLLQKGALLLDARDNSLYAQGHLPSAISISWETLSVSELPFKGNLKTTTELERILSDIGVSHSRTVLVLGDPKNGWGEEGRIAWTLRTLGHVDTYIIDGGHPAMIQEGFSVTKNLPNTTKVKFIAKRNNSWEIEHKELKKTLGNKNLVLIDTRELREFKGETPYGESRGGHIPGAKHFFYKDFLDKNGNLIGEDLLQKKLASLGVDKDSIIVTYCTGGIRSAWVTAILTSSGYQAKNYAGSTWEWSSFSENEYPLSKIK